MDTHKIFFRLSAFLIVVYLFLAIVIPGGVGTAYLAIAAALLLLGPMMLQIWLSWRNMSNNDIEHLLMKEDKERESLVDLAEDKDIDRDNLSSAMGKAMPRLLFLSLILILLGWWWDLLLYYGIAAVFNLLLVIYLAIRKLSLRREI
ncbi:hypothetical protein F9B85_08840 [Heliorestis acidaminivorans]|uniref:Uncharacterized protein n=1 Tax=Heliorestis acidaminivorans TaxID=553427 RepID=A0A6I0EW33_9FIRM|nr:hypothetical protein [Heliorestis acidaminivorans]KAB2952265.1 hypothetical protein F9B85_08840 [Heliorestis acidaminivorans]